jgi:hypothetical protein
MSYSTSLEGEPQQYSMRVMSDLLTQAHIAGLNLDEFVGFFASQVQAMLACPPNYNKFGVKARVWIMRGFYPGSHVFFKIMVADTQDGAGRMTANNGRPQYYVKVTLPRTTTTGRRGQTVEASQYFDGHKLNEDLTDRMENSLLGASNEIRPIVTAKIRMPRCMSPRGLRIYRFEKPKRNRKNAKDDS